MRLLILVSVLSIFSFGLIMIFDTSSAEVLDRALTCSLYQALVRQLLYGGISLCLAFLIWKIDIKDILKISPFLLSLTTLSLVFVLIPGLGICKNGARRWLGMSFLSIQPSEFVKYLVPLVYIEKILSHSKYFNSFLSFLKLFFFLLIPIVLIIIEPDNGTAFVILASLFSLFWVSRLPLKYWLIPLLLLSFLGCFVAYQLTYVRDRLKVYLHPEKDLKGKGHQPYQAKIAAGSGLLFGKGPGASLQKLTYLPEAQNDYIAAIFAEEFGWIGMMILITFYMLFLFGGFFICIKTNSLYVSYLASAITFLITFQVFLNLGVVSGLLPSKGVNLPFFSQGGSSLVANVCGLTLLLKVCNYEKKDIFSCRRNRRTFISCSTIGKQNSR